MALFQIVVAVKARCNKLCIVYQTVLVCVNHLHGFGKVVEFDIYSRDVLEAFLKLLYRQLAITVYVNFREGVSKGLNLVFRDAGGD